MSLAAVDVSRRFAGLLALDRVSLSLAPAEILGLIGPNGSGKTTLLNVLSGTLLPTSGRIVIDGMDVTGWPGHRIARRGVARTFQNLRLFLGLSVAENVDVGSAVRKAGSSRGTRTRDLLRRLDLEAMAHRPASSLAYGEQRRLEIARALATDPRYLLLDEPAAGMSEHESQGLLDRLAVLRDEAGLGLLVIDHDPALLLRMCDRIVVLNEGRVIAQGQPADVQVDPAVVEAYLGAGDDDTHGVDGPTRLRPFSGR